MITVSTYVLLSILAASFPSCTGDVDCPVIGGACFGNSMCPSEGYISGSRFGGTCTGSGMKCCWPLSPCKGDFDLIIGMETSTSVSDDERDDADAFVRDVMAQLNIRETNVHVALFSVSKQAIQACGLLEDYSASDASACVDAIDEQKEQQSRSHKGFKLALQKFNADGRTGKDKIYVHIADNTNNSPKAIQFSDDLKAVAKIIMVKVAPGNNLAGLETAPSSENLFEATTWAGLSSLVDGVVESICRGTTPAAASCANGAGSCFCDDDNECPDGFGAPATGSCTGQDMNCCVQDQRCFDEGGECFDNNTCPNMYEGVGGEGGKCFGSLKKCCRPETHK